MLYSKIFKKIVILAVFAAQVGQIIGGGQTHTDFSDILVGGFLMKATRVMTSAVHELGHALTAKLFFNQYNSIHISLGSVNSGIWYSNKYVTLKHDMFFPAKAQYAQTAVKHFPSTQALKSAVIMAAGPAAGLAMAGCIGYAGYKAESQENKNLSATLYGISAVRVCSELNQFVPRINVEQVEGRNSDGARISEVLHLSEAAKRTFSRSVRTAMAASLGIAGARIWNVYSNAKAENQL